MSEDYSGVVDIARNGVDEVIKLTREVNDLALLCARLVKRMRAAREGKGTAIGDANLEMTVIKYLTRHGLHPVARVANTRRMDAQTSAWRARR